MRVLEHLLKSLRDAGIYNPEVQVAPACILWPDRERQWEAIIPRLQADLPQLLVLGDYAPAKRIGPAIWLRCVLAGKAEHVSLPPGCTPIFYLPAISRQDLRAVENCPERLKPLAELQYRGVIWSQINAKDWTILSFLKSDQGGLGLDVAQDADTRTAMQLALSRVMDEQIDLLRGKRLDKDYFNTLLTGGDPVRDLLQWLDQGDGYQQSRGNNEWKAFVENCKSQFAFDPHNEGLLAGAARLAAHEGVWLPVWERFCEAPKRYPNIPVQIRKCGVPNFDLFATAATAAGWPQWNETQEQALRSDLAALGNIPAHQARNRLIELERQHGERRSLVWAELGEAPLALALQPLAMLAEITSHSLAAGTVADLVTGYCNRGWKADDALLQALALVDKAADVDAISAVIRAIYQPWAEDSARYLQKIVDGNSYPGGTIATAPSVSSHEGECVFFVDGLRFDTGKRLLELLRTGGFEVSERAVWSALPSVTATAKAAVTPVKAKISGPETSVDFEPCVAATGQSLKGGYYLKKLLTESGWTILDRNTNGNGEGKSWCEFGDIDHEGHDRGWKLAKHVDPLLKEIAERIAALLAAGWASVRVVTDHGWLLLPGGLPKVEMSSVLTDSKWGRCAALKSGATSDERLYPWFWNPHQYFALADGISCFKKGQEYTHGGLSLQECLTVELTVLAGAGSYGSGSTQREPVEFTDVNWKGLRCTVAVDGNFAGCSLDIRDQAGNADTSVVVGTKQLKDNGTASVVVEDEERAGQKATLVLLDSKGRLVAQMATVIGGENA